MELRHLRYFIAVAEEQNITRAAARLHISQPPLSRQIRDLEDLLKVSLFQRSGKSIHLTEAGRFFLLEARAVLQRADEAVQSVQAIASGNRGELHIGYAPSLTVEILPRALRRFQESIPGVKVVLHDLSTQDMIRMLRAKQLHIAMLARIPGSMLKSLLFTPLATYPICMALAASHRLAKQKSITIDQAARQPLVTYGSKDYPEYHEWLTSVFPQNLYKLRIAEEHDSATSLIASVEADRGIAMVPSCLACLAGPRLKIRPLTPAPAPMVVGIAHLPKLQPLAAQFVENIASSGS